MVECEKLLREDFAIVLHNGARYVPTLGESQSRHFQTFDRGTTKHGHKVMYKWHHGQDCRVYWKSPAGQIYVAWKPQDKKTFVISEQFDGSALRLRDRFRSFDAAINYAATHARLQAIKESKND